MIGKLIALVQNVRSRPPGPLSAVVGAAIAAGGIALISRYQNHLVGQLQTTANALGQLDDAYAVKEESLAHLKAEVLRLDGQRTSLLAETIKLTEEAADAADATAAAPF